MMISKVDTSEVSVASLYMDIHAREASHMSKGSVGFKTCSRSLSTA